MIFAVEVQSDLEGLPMERFSFYERTKKAYAIVLTGELQPYANFLFKKGVIGEPLAA